MIGFSHAQSKVVMSATADVPVEMSSDDDVVDAVA